MGELEMRQPILITGAARSGTSMTAGIVNMCGAFGGVMSGPTENNKKGMFENILIRNNIIKPYLKLLKCDPLGQNPLPDLSDMGVTDKMERDAGQLKGKVQAIFQDQGLVENMIWFYKGAKMCLMWPLWDAAFPKAKWIIIRRRPADIINSCMRTGFMRAYNSSKGWMKWVEHHEMRFAEMNENRLNVWEVWPEKIINHNLSEIKQTIIDMGLTWNEQLVLDFISPALWKKGVEHGPSN